MVVSDHGFGPSRKDFFVNRWLEELGLFKPRKNPHGAKIRLSVSLHRFLTKFFPRVSWPRWTGKIPIFAPKKVPRSKTEMVDWAKTKAYGDEFGVNINMAGREPHGIVKPGRETEALLDFIQKRFQDLADESESEEKIGDWILRKEEIYEGPFVNEASDLYLSLKDESYLLNADIGAPEKFGKALVNVGTGIHRSKGIFIMKKPPPRRLRR